MIFSWRQNHIVNQRVIYGSVVTLLSFAYYVLLKQHVHNNLIIIQANVSEEKYYVYMTTFIQTQK